MKKILLTLTMITSLFSNSFYLEPIEYGFLKTKYGTTFLITKIYMSRKDSKAIFCKANLSNMVVIVPVKETFRVDIFIKDKTDCSEFYN